MLAVRRNNYLAVKVIQIVFVFNAISKTAKTYNAEMQRFVASLPEYDVVRLLESR